MAKAWPRTPRRGGDGEPDEETPPPPQNTVSGPPHLSMFGPYFHSISLTLTKSLTNSQLFGHPKHFSEVIFRNDLKTPKISSKKRSDHEVILVLVLKGISEGL